MIEVNVGTDLVFETPNNVGVLAKISKAMTGAEVNIQAICAHTQGNKGRFMLTTDDNSKALEALKKIGIEAKEREVVLMELENEVGSLSEVSKMLADADINLDSIYASAGESYSSLIVFSCDDNAKAVATLG